MSDISVDQAASSVVITPSGFVELNIECNKAPDIGLSCSDPSIVNIEAGVDYTIEVVSGAGCSTEIAVPGHPTVELGKSGDTGPIGPSGLQGPPGPPGSGDFESTWMFLATTWSTPPTITGSHPSGSVFSYTLDSVTKYRFVPTIYISSSDSFYSSWDNVSLSGLIVSRG